MGCDSDSRLYRARRAAGLYLDAKASLVAQGFDWEIEWQNEIRAEQVTESQFLREAAWVILCSGFSERTVRACFEGVSQAFRSWRSATEIWTYRRECRTSGLRLFGSRPKLDAIIAVSGYVARCGFAQTHDRIVSDGIGFLMRFPFIGPATGRHLAKNLGLDYAKPDRHLLRLASAFGYEDVDTLCDDIASIVGDKIGVIDVVLWRYATLRSRQPWSVVALAS